jgi:hypothetical protein
MARILSDKRGTHNRLADSHSSGSSNGLGKPRPRQNTEILPQIQCEYTLALSTSGHPSQPKSVWINLRRKPQDFNSGVRQPRESRRDTFRIARKNYCPVEYMRYSSQVIWNRYHQKWSRENIRPHFPIHTNCHRVVSIIKL